MSFAILFGSRANLLCTSQSFLLVIVIRSVRWIFLMKISLAFGMLSFSPSRKSFLSWFYLFFIFFSTSVCFFMCSEVFTLFCLYCVIF